MKHLSSFFIFSFFALQLLAQGTITNITVVPANPTENDNVEIHVDLQFSNGDCDVDDQGFGINGTAITAYAHHCMGFLTVICPTTDIYEIGQLAAGLYTFDMTLSSGFGGPGCSPGIVPDDSEQFQFSVSTTVGVEELNIDENLVFPNPVDEQLNFKNALKETAVILNLSGQIVHRIPEGVTSIDVSGLESGIYVLSFGSRKIRILKN
jgi:hypothetical protein